ncbi:MAG: DUF4157 domain-containing protein [Chromatiales bacterium]
MKESVLRRKLRYIHQLDDQEAQPFLKKYDHSLELIEQQIQKASGSEATDLIAAVERLRTLRKARKVTCWQTEGGGNPASYDSTSGEIRLHIFFGEQATNPDNLMHEAIHAVHGARFPKLSKSYGKALEKGKVTDEKLGPLLLKWKAWTEYWAYRRTAEFDNARQTEPRFRQDPHKVAIETKDVVKSIESIRQHTREDFEPWTWTPPEKYQERPTDPKSIRREKTKGVLRRTSIAPSPANDVPPVVYEVLKSSGQPLDPSTLAFMEPRFGHDFSFVRVHTDAKAAESARAVNALAYTVGRNVVFGAGQYAPGTTVGKRLLAHELTHVVQQERLKDIQFAATEDAPSKGLPRSMRYQPEENITLGGVEELIPNQLYRVIGFDIGSADVNKRGIKEGLEPVIQYLLTVDDAAPSVTITGLASESRLAGKGAFSYGWDRADAIKHYLSLRGVSKIWIKTTTRGSIGAPPINTPPEVKAYWRAAILDIRLSGKPKPGRPYTGGFEPSVPSPPKGRKVTDIISLIPPRGPITASLKLIKFTYEALRELGYANQAGKMEMFRNAYRNAHADALADLTEADPKNRRLEYYKNQCQHRLDVEKLRDVRIPSTDPVFFGHVMDAVRSTARCDAYLWVISMGASEYAKWAGAWREDYPEHEARLRAFLSLHRE